MSSKPYDVVVPPGIEWDTLTNKARPKPFVKAARGVRSEHPKREIRTTLLDEGRSQAAE
jgi:hypothetical protein